MPGMDGYTAVALLRREARLTPLPFIALSADVSTEAAAAARQAGLCAFVGKPFDPESLASVTLREVARARGLASPPVTAAPIAAVTTDPPPPSPAWPALPGIDIPQAQRQSRQDPDRFRRYLQQLLQQFSALREASALPEDAAGRAQVLAQCHKLAGSAGIVGALALGELARRAERAGRQDDWPQVQAGLEDIALALSALAEAASRLNTE
jgi:HPt (histidine-containing phosphotransfer) domain-containing protein